MYERMEEWLQEVFATEVSIRPVDGNRLCEERRRDFRLWAVDGLATEFLMVSPRPGVRNPPVTGIAKLLHELRERSVRWVAYGTDVLSAVERKRLLARQVPFVVTGRQVFLPFLGIALRPDSAALARNCIGKAAQRFILAYLEGHTGPFDNQLVYRKMKCPVASAYRAYSELESFGLIDRTPRGIVFRNDARASFRRFTPRLKSSPYKDAIVAMLYDENRFGPVVIPD